MATDKTADVVAHTPGPWTPLVDAGGFRLFVVANAPSGNVHRITVADCPHPADALWSHQRIANARLIAAAPDMLAALKEYIEWGAMTGSDRDFFDRKFRAAIAKAEGRP